LVIVDGGSTDNTVTIAKKYSTKVFSTPLNAPAAYNYAMKHTNSPILGFIDADAKVEKNWLNKLLPHMTHQKIAGASGGIETWNTENSWARSIGYDMKSRYARLEKYAVRIATMNLLLKKSVIEEAGGFDENMPSQYDTDLGFRITSLGYKIIYEPTAKCYHFNRTNLKAFFRQQLQYGKNTLKLYFKHASLAKGDRITDFGMNIQPILFLTIAVLALLGVAPFLRLLWYAAGGLFLFIVAYYIFCAVKIALKFKDKSAIRLVLLYFIRSCAWFAGAIITSVKYIAGDRR
jgi:cellulose synthase/poly-beta-1,6-N-acetylglucosamine synthase-like glycosyltransferase